MATRWLALAALLLVLPATAAAKPVRVVSLNLCIDEILIDLVERERIAGLSHLAGDPAMTSRWAEMRRLPLVHGSAEEVLALDPDLVLAGEGSTPATVGMLERLGRRVVKITMASSLAEIRTAVAAVADAVGEPERGRALVAGFDRRLAEAGARQVTPAPSAVAIQINSLTSGQGSLLDEVVTAAGLHNKARDLEAQGALGPAQRLPLETLLTDPPDLIVLANAAGDYRTVLADNLRHTAFQKLVAERPSIHLPLRTWLCGIPSIAGTVERLAAARSQLVIAGRPLP